jgi:hypothetical protein
VRIGTLDSPLPSGYAYYDYANTTLDITSTPPTLPAGSLIELPTAPYYGENAFFFGRSPTASFATETSIAVGKNILDRWVVDASSSHDAVAAIRDEVGDPNFVSSEAYLAVGDSGGPLMVETAPGELTIVGLNWFIDTLGDGTQISGFSYLGNYSSEIDAYISANPVPEPFHFGLASGLLALAATALRRHQDRNPGTSL